MFEQLVSADNLARRIAELDSVQRRALAWTVHDLTRHSRHDTSLAEIRVSLHEFALPFAEMGLSLAQMLAITRKLPADWPADHREVYFDFRLQRWMRILEIPTLEECLRDHVLHADTPEDGLDYLESRIGEFFAGQGRTWTPPLSDQA